MSCTNPPTVRTPRLLLRPLVESDRAEYVRAHEHSRDFFRPWQPLPKPGATLDDAFTDEMTRGPELERLGTGCKRVAELLPDACRDFAIDPALRRPVVAIVSLNNITRGAFHNTDMGWRVVLEFTRRGLGVEAVSAMLDLAFAPPPLGLGLHRVQANIIPANEPSLRLAARAGFRREGYALRMLNINGQWQDHIMHAKLADEHEPVYLGAPR
jgi:ribosomal-protein-alanine N-acetyltransferase